MYVAILGRQPLIGLAELERLYGSHAVSQFSDICATIDTESFDFNRLGGSQKAGRVVARSHGNWNRISKEIIDAYSSAWQSREGKITLGISAYGFPAQARDVQKTGLILKKNLRQRGVSLRLVPNAEPALNTAASHHNKLGLSDNHIELLVVRAASGKVVIAESVGSQNITAFASRDQARPHTDAFVGMLPPKLARMMTNLAIGPSIGGAATSFSEDSAFPSHDQAVLDPFCGTGVVLQEAMLDGYTVNGTDLSEKMVDYTTKNLHWLTETHKTTGTIGVVRQGDAMNHTWDFPIDAVVSEAYLGQPFSAPPSPAKLTEVRGNCDHIISKFLQNIAPQIKSGTPLCLAIPAWRSKDGSFTHLPLISHLDHLGYRQITLKNVRPDQLLYYRETQVVARELLLLEKA